MKQVILLTLLLFSLNLPAEQSGSGDYEDELVFRLVENYAEGEVVWLGAAGSPFLGLFREAANDHTGRAVIILHSMGGHADWPDVIAPLRTGLPGKGWATLSIQLPVLSPRQPIAGYGRTFDSARTRLGAAVKFLSDRGYPDIVLVGYSFGATSAVNYLLNEQADIRAFVGISMQRHAFLSPAYNLVEELGKVSVPVLDVYGSQDFSEVRGSADTRRIAVNQGGNSAYSQLVIDDADHYFSGHQTLLLGHLAAWLDKVVPALLPLDTENIYFL